MRGDLSFTQGNVASIVLVIISAVLILGFATGTIGGLQEIKELVCKSNPELAFCGEHQATIKDFEDSKKSALALSCAINTVTTDDPLKPDCADDFSGSDDSTKSTGTGLLTGFAVSVVEGGYEFIQDETGCAFCGKEERCDDKCFEEFCDNGGIHGCEVVVAELITSGTNKCNCRVKIPSQPTIYFGSAGKSWDCIAFTSEDSSGNANLGRVFGDTNIEGREKCEKLVKAAGFEQMGYYMAGEKDEVTATVYNFRLQQKLESKDGSSTIKEVAEESIAQMGDPKYVVYYQVFPQGEDYWNSMSAWYEDSGQAIFMALCISHALKPLGSVLKMGRSAVMKPLSTLSSATGKTKAAVDWMKSKFSGISLEKGMFSGWWTRRGLAKQLAKANMNHEVVNIYTAKYGRSAVSRYLDDVATTGIKPGSATYEELKTVFNNMANEGLLAKDTQILAKYLPKETSESVVRSMLKTMKPEAWAATKEAAAMAGLDIATYYVLRSESEFGKFMDEYPQSIVLQNTMNEDDLRTSSEKDPELHLGNMEIEKPENVVNPEFQPIVSLGKPVVMNRPEWASSIKPLVLTSPCRANIKIRSMEDPIKCSIYAYDMTTQMSSCISPDDDGFTLEGGMEQLQVDLSKDYRCGTIPYNEYRLDIIAGKVKDDVVGFFTMDGLKPVQREYSFIENQMEKTVVFGEETQINVDAVCCMVSFKSGPLSNTNTYYGWMENSSCSLEYMQGMGDSKTYKDVQVIGEDNSDYTLCSGEKPVSPLRVKKIIDPLNGMTLYYNPSLKSIGYFDDGTGIKSLIPSYHLNRSSYSATPEYIRNGACVFRIPGGDKYSPDYGISDGEHLVCDVRNVKSKPLDGFGTSGEEMKLTYKVYGERAFEGQDGVNMYVLSMDYGVYSDKHEEHTTVVMKDEGSESRNGKIDTVQHIVWKYLSTSSDVLVSETYSEKTSDSSFISDPSGNVVSYLFNGAEINKNGLKASGSCYVDSISIEPETIDVEGEYNYCYKKDYSSVAGVVTTTVSFGADAIIKSFKIGGWWGWLLSTATDCGMAIAHHKLQFNWPGSKG